MELSKEKAALGYDYHGKHGIVLDKEPINGYFFIIEITLDGPIEEYAVEGAPPLKKHVHFFPTGNYIIIKGIKFPVAIIDIEAEEEKKFDFKLWSPFLLDPIITILGEHPYHGKVLDDLPTIQGYFFVGNGSGERFIVQGGPLPPGTKVHYLPLPDIEPRTGYQKAQIVRLGWH